MKVIGQLTDADAEQLEQSLRVWLGVETGYDASQSAK